MSLRLTKEVCHNLQQFKQIYRANNDYQHKINNAHERLITASHRLNSSSSNIAPNIKNNDSIPIEQQYDQLKQMYKEALTNTEKEQNLIMVTLAKLQEIIEKREDEANGITNQYLPTPATMDVVESSSSSSSDPKSTASSSSATTFPSSEASSTTASSSSSSQMEDDEDHTSDSEATTITKKKSSSPSTATTTTSSISQAPSSSTATTTTSRDESREDASTTRGSMAKKRKETVKSENQASSSLESTSEKGSTVASAAAALSSGGAAVTTMESYLGQDDTIPSGSKVAARVSGQSDSEEEELWILAKIVGYNSSHKKYSVEDVDVGEDSKGPKKYKLPRKHLIVLSKDFSEHTVFKKGNQVLAMYPDTTSFYAATVHTGPSTSNNYTYQVKFEDDEDDSGRTPARKVSYKNIAPMPEKEVIPQASKTRSGGKQTQQQTKKRRRR